MAPLSWDEVRLEVILQCKAWRLALMSENEKGQSKRNLARLMLGCCVAACFLLSRSSIDSMGSSDGDARSATERIRVWKDKEGFLRERPPEPITVAYAISLIKCSDQHSTPAGLIDAALTLRHSVYLTSSRNNGRSHYDFEMFAIVHEQAESCSHVLKDAGFRIIIQKKPVERSEIEDPTLRQGIQKALCCGEDEFIKLWAYELTDYPIVVHSDMDFLFLNPMDGVFDSMLFSPESTIGRTAREQLLLEFPQTAVVPRNITACMTRDWPQVRPGRIPAYQAGLMIVQPDPSVRETMLQVVRTHSYTPGFGRDNGWGGLGYGAFIGSMAMVRRYGGMNTPQPERLDLKQSCPQQGLVAYVYDTILNGTWVELNQCRFNHMGMDVYFKPGQCRNNRDYCEDCMVTPLTGIYSAHYTHCRKPWACIGESRKDRDDKKAMIDGQVLVDHCLELQRQWHNTRNDLEDRLHRLTGDSSILESRSGKYFPDVFQGHCTNFSSSGYLRIVGKNESFRRVPELYAL